MSWTEVLLCQRKANGDHHSSDGEYLLSPGEVPRGTRHFTWIRSLSYTITLGLQDILISSFLQMRPLKLKKVGSLVWEVRIPSGVRTCHTVPSWIVHQKPRILQPLAAVRVANPGARSWPVSWLPGSNFREWILEIWAGPTVNEAGCYVKQHMKFLDGLRENRESWLSFLNESTHNQRVHS